MIKKKPQKQQLMLKQKKTVTLRRDQQFELKRQDFQLEMYHRKLYPAVSFPEYEIQEMPTEPGRYRSSRGVDLHTYFLAASYDKRTEKLTFDFAVANWGDTPCLKAFAYYANPQISSYQAIHNDEWRDHKHKLQYKREFVAAGRPQKDVSLKPGEIKKHTVTYDMSDPTVWAAGGVKLYIVHGTDIKEGHTPGDKEKRRWGTYKNSAWLPIRPGNFDRKPVIVAQKVGNVFEKVGSSILRIELARFKNMGVSGFPLTDLKMKHVCYNKRIDPSLLLSDPEKFERYKIPIRPPFRDYKRLDRTELHGALHTSEFLRRGETIPYKNDVDENVWNQAKTILIRLERWKLEEKIKYPHLSSIVYHK